MTDLIEDYLREVQASLRVEATRKRQIVDELRTHLTERVAEEHDASPGRPREDVEREVLRDAGSPRDLALAYDPDGGAAVLLNRSGDIVLRLGKVAAAAGRGATRALKWTAVGLAVLLVVAMGVGAWAYYEVKPFIPTIIESQEPVYEYGETCATPCSGTYPADAFFVRDGADTVRFELYLYPIRLNGDVDRDAGNGTVTVTVTDADGLERYERILQMGDDARLRYEASWSAVPGNWTVQYTFDGFVGRIAVHTHAYGFPRP